MTVAFWNRCNKKNVVARPVLSGAEVEHIKKVFGEDRARIYLMLKGKEAQKTLRGMESIELRRLEKEIQGS